MAIQLDLGSVDNVPDACLHLLPCNIEYDGAAKVKNYFTTSLRENTDGQGLKASFRGRPLQGQEFKVPSGYTGLVLKEPHKKFSEEEERNWKAVHTFDKLTYWNLDSVPSAYDKIQRATEWLKIAKAIHAPVNEDSLMVEEDTKSPYFEEKAS